MLVNAFFLQLLNNFNLGCNTCMVRPRLPERIITLHPLKPNQDILHGIVQRMSHVELSRDIWRGNHNGKRLFIMVHLRVKILFVHPFLIQSVLYALRVIGLCQFFAHKFFLHFFAGFCCHQKSPLPMFLSSAKGDFSRYHLCSQQCCLSDFY